jgi:uncharacterized protein (TIGR02145 family)
LGLLFVFSNTVFSQTSSDVKIGTQVWMSKNLDISTFRNGDEIPEIKTKKDWIKAGKNKQPAWCYYEFNKKNGKIYGKLYNGFAVNDTRGLAPKGYHVPAEKEWNTLLDFLGGDSVTGKKMKSTEGWWSYSEGKDEECYDCEDWTVKRRKKEVCSKCNNTLYLIKPVISGDGDNSSGFNGLPGGYLTHDGNFLALNVCGSWWSSVEKNDRGAWRRYIFNYGSYIYRGYYGMEYGFSVRCLKD